MYMTTNKYFLHFYIEQQKLMAENERLKNEKADLLNRLQCYEEDLKRVNECEKLYYLCLSN